MRRNLTIPPGPAGGDNEDDRLDTLLRILIEFGRLALVVLPYFVLGALVGAVVETYVKPDALPRYLHRGAWSVVVASVFGAVLPGCSCASMPVAQGLRRRGAQVGTVAAFVLVAPLLSPQTVVLTVALLGWRFAVARVGCSLLAGIVLGLLFNWLEHGVRAKGFVALPVAPDAEAPSACGGEGGDGACPTTGVRLWRSFLEIVKDLAKYVALGLLIAAVLVTLVPEESIPKTIGASGPLAYATAVLVGVPLYVCEGEEIPITRALLDKGLGPGPAFAFLLGSVGTCVPTLLMARKVLGGRPTLLYALAWFPFTVGSGLLFSLFYGA